MLALHCRSDYSTRKYANTPMLARRPIPLEMEWHRPCRPIWDPGHVYEQLAHDHVCANASSLLQALELTRCEKAGIRLHVLQLNL